MKAFASGRKSRKVSEKGFVLFGVAFAPERQLRKALGARFFTLNLK